MILWNNPLPTRLKADQVEVSGNGLISGKTGEDMFFQIKPKDLDEENRAQFSATNCQVTFEGPSKPVIKFRTGENNVVMCSWMAFLPGDYKIIIRYADEEINGSPFTCHVTESEKGIHLQEEQLAKIKCTGALEVGFVNEPNEVRVNEVNGCIGGLRVLMEGPGKSVISFRTNPDDESLSMFYQVPNIGDYNLIIKFMNHHVRGSPFKITVK